MSAPGGERKKTACVTGGNGYIASALIKMLLDKGYAVKTTVRNPGSLKKCFAETTDDMAKNSHLKELQALGPLEILRASLDDEGSFDGAVAGCDYAFLVAAPVNVTKSDNPEQDTIEAAVRGTLNVMRSCVKAGTVRRVVLTSSAAGVYGSRRQGDGHVLDEDSWSDVDYLTTYKPTPMWAYGVSKVLLEKVASAFAAEHGLSLATVCPVITVGAAPAPVVRTSVPNCLSLLSGDEAQFGVLRFIETECGALSFVHVGDLCRAELFAAEEPAAAGRYICCSVNTTIVELARFLEKKYPHSGELLEEPRASLSSAKLVREGFEFRYKTLDEIYDDDVIEYGKALGILPKN
ncbi:hypothetical protein ACP4OV_025672 [Aristida adscensionis]